MINIYETWYVKLPNEDFLRKAIISGLMDQVVELYFTDNTNDYYVPFKINDVEFVEKVDNV